MLYNLIGNSIKFTFKGNISVILSTENNFLRTSVIDTGVGISQENLSKLFKNFGKLEDKNLINKGGLGFGLSICKNIC